jgi:hypothetical protein
MSKRRDKKKNKHPKSYEPIWIEGHRLNEKTGKLEPVRYKLKWKPGGVC